MTYSYPTEIHHRLHPGLLSRRPSGGELHVDEVLCRADRGGRISLARLAHRT